MSNICSAEGCLRAAKLRHYCQAHYKKFLRYGDPLYGSTRVSHGEPLFFIENIAVPYKHDDCLIWPFSKNMQGYGQINISGRPKGAHRVVCEKAHGPAPTLKHEAAHSCGNGHLSCVNPHHLSWKTRSENQADKIIHGTVCTGIRNPQTKLSEKDVLAIRELSQRGMSNSEVSKIIGTSPKNVSKINRRERWGWLNDSSEERYEAAR